MNNKKGFVFIETIIVITVLATSLLLIYSSFTNAFVQEKIRLYYDDPAFIYKSYIIYNYLYNNSDLSSFANTNIKSADKFFTIIGEDSLGLWKTDKNHAFGNLRQNYNVYQAIIIDPNKISDINTCTNTPVSTVCSDYNNLPSAFRKYIKTLNNTDTTNYLVLFWYRIDRNGVSCASNNSTCNSYFVWLDSGVKVNE